MYDHMHVTGIDPKKNKPIRRRGTTMSRKIALLCVVLGIVLAAFVSSPARESIRGVTGLLKYDGSAGR